MKRAVAAIFTAWVVAAVATAPLLARDSKARNSNAVKVAVLDINRASAVDFEKLPGIGPELARRIVTYRKEHGPFRRVEDLLAVRGMGPKKWRAIKPYIRVQGGELKTKKQRCANCSS
jgi:competence protein ComEA